MKKVMPPPDGKFHPVIRINKKHPMLSFDDSEPTFNLYIPVAMLDNLATRLHKMLEKCKKTGESFVSFDFSGCIFIPNESILINLNNDEDCDIDYTKA